MSHTIRSGDTVFHVNSDFSGYVSISRDGCSMRIPFKDMLSIVHKHDCYKFWHDGLRMEGCEMKGTNEELKEAWRRGMCEDKQEDKVMEDLIMAKRDAVLKAIVGLNVNILYSHSSLREAVSKCVESGFDSGISHFEESVITIDESTSPELFTELTAGQCQESSMKAICDMVVELTAMEVERTEGYIASGCEVDQTDITKFATRLLSNCVKGAGLGGATI